MALDTYAHLQTAIGNWLNRGDLATQIPDFITVAEAQMRREIKKSLMKGKMLPRAMVTTNAAFSLPAGTELVNVPSDFVGVYDFFITVDANAAKWAVQLDYASPRNLDLMKQRRGSAAPNYTPGMFSIVGAQFQILPIPDVTYTASLTYWQDFANLAVANGGVNWILTNHPDAYLYGALTAAAPYLMDDARVQMWATLFQRAVDDLIAADPLPTDRTWLRADPALTFLPRHTGAFNITTGDYMIGPI